MEKYDSTKETQEHIDKVSTYLHNVAKDLKVRGQVHDASKLQSPEKEYFNEYSPRLATLTYGTPEYLQNVQDLKPALEHHFANNSHHPQFYKEGLNGMNLYDLIEMFYDWRAATERGVNGDIMKSIKINANRFGISKQLKQILINTENYEKAKTR